MNKMTHRERLMAAVSHRQPDTVPIDLAGTRDSSIVVEGYEKLKKTLRYPGRYPALRKNDAGGERG